MSLPNCRGVLSLNLWPGFLLLQCLLLVSTISNSYAQLVLYDGAIGDANPVTQGWNLTLNSDPSIATVTPDPTNDYVFIKVENDFVGDPEDPRDWSYSLPSNLSSLQGQVGDDSYHWTIQFQLNEFIYNGIPTGTTRHTRADFHFITGTDSGSAGHDDRMYIYADRVMLPSSLEQPEQVRGYFAFDWSKLFPTFPEGSPSEFDVAPNWNSMLEMNEITFNRVGNQVEMYANGDFIYSGYSYGNSDISSTQVYMNDLADSERVDMNWAQFEVGDALPLMVSDPPDPRSLYDGAYFGGDPIKQGWEVDPLSPDLTLTPDDATDSVRLENSGSNFRFKIPLGLTKSLDEAKDDYYRWSVTFSVDETNNENALLKYVGGARRETLDFQGDQIVVDPSVTGTGNVPLQAMAGFDMMITPGETPNFTSMSDVNELVCYRSGDEVLITINGDIVFRGAGGNQNLGTDGQLEIVNSPSGGDTDITFYKVSISTALEGDYDGDNDVDEDDFLLWRDNFGAVIPYIPDADLLRIDGNRNGVIDAADYTVWRDHFGQSVPFLGLTVPGSGAGSGAAVPEPNSGLLACLAMACGAGLLRNRFRYAGRRQRRELAAPG